jgi:hypothetical protein
MPIRSLCLVATLLSVLLAVASAAAELRTEEARVLAEAASGVSLVGAKAVPREGTMGRFVEFQTSDPRATYRVNLTLGQLDLWSLDSHPAPDALARLTADEAFASARAAARRAMGEAADGLTWAPAVDHGNPLVLDCSAEGKPLGDPPLPGLCARCTAMVSMVDGTVLSYEQYIPDPDSPARVLISEEQARAAALAYARDHVSWGAGAVTGQPSVTRAGGPRRFTWWVPVRPDVPVQKWDGDERIVEIDAATGEIVVVCEPESGAPSVPSGTGSGVAAIAKAPLAPAGPRRPSASAAPASSPPPGFPWLPVGGGAAVVMLAAGALILRRRARP